MTVWNRRVAALFALLLPAASVAWMPTAAAQWYFSGNVGGVYVHQSEFDTTFTGGTGAGRLRTEPGWSMGGALGYDFGAVRFEGEVSFRRAGLDRLTIDALTLTGVGSFGSLGAFAATGAYSALGFLGNVYLDFPMMGRFQPYVGAGLGLSRNKLKVDTLGGTAVGFRDTNLVFAGQAILGLAYELTPFIRAELSYRFLATTENEFSDGIDVVATEYYSHAVMIGVSKRL